jgi:hypothetical protein
LYSKDPQLQYSILGQSVGGIGALTGRRRSKANWKLADDAQRLPAME